MYWLDGRMSEQRGQRWRILQVRTNNFFFFEMRKVFRCKALEEYVRDCQSRDRSLHLEDWRSLHHCGKCASPPGQVWSLSPCAAAVCPPGLVHHDCYHHKCQHTCSSLRDEAACPPIHSGICFPGCFCPDGLVKDGSKCVLPSKCRNCESGSWFVKFSSR